MLSRAEVAEQMIIDAHATTDPHVSQVASAQPIKLPGSADTFDRREHPQRDEDFRIDGIVSGLSVDGLNSGVQGSQVERINISPHRTSLMIVRQQLIQGERPPFHLPAFRPLDSNPFRPTRRCLFHNQSFSANKI